MGGLPTRTNRDALGESYENTYPVNNPKKEIGADIFNIAFWNNAGICQVAPMAVIKASVSGSTVTVDFFGLAFDPNGQVTPLTITRVGVGFYHFEFDTQYPDEGGTDRTLALSHGMAAPVNSILARGSHTGSNNAAVLTDSTKSWSVDELVGQTVYNVTDNSFGVIASNTADTITATLAGGTDDDWDTADAYLVIQKAHSGLVNLMSAYQCDVMFFDKDRALVDPTEFMVALW